MNKKVLIVLVKDWIAEKFWTMAYRVLKRLLKKLENIESKVLARAVLYLEESEID